MKIAALSFGLLLILSSSICRAAMVAEPILLWPAGAPGASGTSDEDKPAIIPFIPEANARNGAAVLVIPGGSFAIRAVDHEGVLIAQWLKARGISAFVLRYRLTPLYGREHWVRDGQRALQYIRAHAVDYGVSPDRVGAIGFSAGANLIADMAFHPLQPKKDAQDPLDRFSTNPNFMVLAYGYFQMPAQLNESILSQLPPTFMFSTAEDRGSMDGMLELHRRLYQAQVPVEAHFFQNGQHGVGFALGDPTLGKWPDLMLQWLTVGKWLTPKTQLPVNGVVKLNGAPLVRGMLVLTPVNQPTAPPVVAYIANLGTGELGRFAVPAHQGPVPGKYRVEVRQDATRWTSNSRDPFMINVLTKQRNNELTDADKKAWGEYLRKRNLAPSIDNQRVFSRQRPKDKTDYVVDIKDDRELLIEVYSD